MTAKPASSVMPMEMRNCAPPPPPHDQNPHQPPPAPRPPEKKPAPRGGQQVPPEVAQDDPRRRKDQPGDAGGPARVGVGPKEVAPEVDQRPAQRADGQRVAQGDVVRPIGLERALYGRDDQAKGHGPQQVAQFVEPVDGRGAAPGPIAIMQSSAHRTWRRRRSRSFCTMRSRRPLAGPSIKTAMPCSARPRPQPSSGKTVQCRLPKPWCEMAKSARLITTNAVAWMYQPSFAPARRRASRSISLGVMGWASGVMGWSRGWGVMGCPRGWFQDGGDCAGVAGPAPAPGDEMRLRRCEMGLRWREVELR